MQEIISLILIGIGLSMDTFSISLSIGTLKISKKDINLISIIVGIFHFIMPLLGLIVGKNILELLNINPEYLLSIVLFILSIKLIKDYFNNQSIEIDLSILSIITLAFSVSIDSFTTGIALYTITNNILIATLIFSTLSFIFTYIGLNIGKYASNKIGKYATIIGILLLLFVSFLHLF